MIDLYLERENSWVHEDSRNQLPSCSGQGCESPGEWVGIVPTTRAPCCSRVSRLTAWWGGQSHLQQSLKVRNISVIHSIQTLPATSECTCFPVCPQLTGSCGELLLASRARELDLGSPSKDQNSTLETQFLPCLRQVTLSSDRPPWVDDHM